MAFPGAPGYNQVPNAYFRPEVWSLRMLKNYYEQAIAPSICNHDYEGEIKNHGDKVIIRRDPEVELHAYTKGMILKSQTVEDEGTEFPIERGVYFNFPVDDVERKQSDVPWVEKVTSNASIKTKNYIDQLIFSVVYADVPAANILAADTTLDKDSIDATIVGLRRLLNEAHIPDDGRRWMIVPYYAESSILLNTLFVSAADMGDDTSMIRNGRIGVLGNFNIYPTSNIYNDGTDDYILAGHPDAITFATQITKTEVLRNPNSFGDLIRGLQVFDFKVIQPTALCYQKVQSA